MDDAMDWERLGQYVRRARGPRSQKAIRAAGGPTDTTISKIEANEWRPTRGVDKTLEKLEKGLGWQPGDAARILSGDEPLGSVVIQPSPARIVLLSQVPTFDLLDELRNRVVSDPKSVRPAALQNGEEWSVGWSTDEDPGVGRDEDRKQRNQL